MRENQFKEIQKVIQKIGAIKMQKTIIRGGNSVLQWMNLMNTTKI
jgi:hypothetical protein